MNVTVMASDGEAHAWVYVPRELFEECDLIALPALLDAGIQQVRDGQAG